MKKEEIITAVIMTLIIALEIFIQCYTRKSVSNLKESLESLKQETLSEEKDNDNLKEKSKEIYNEWMKDFNIMAYFIEHEELEKVSTQMRIIMAEYEADNIDETVTDIEEGIFILEHIRDKQKINLKNIF